MLEDAKAKKVQFNVYLPASLVTQIKHRAIDEQTSLSSLVERIMNDYVSQEGTS
ncbi:CopG family transcriptional regulator [Paramicrobacterium chengjingii]|uniref:CopG family transcriptional regulator n=1 Tax=Paramicrobacterium chengjingii TaxID=2769067 RepID=UPI001422AA82|nr:CopG family transcriptional regulator [Microbacterium chengjingii]